MENIQFLKRSIDYTYYEILLLSEMKKIKDIQPLSVLLITTSIVVMFYTLDLFIVPNTVLPMYISERNAFSHPPTGFGGLVLLPLAMEREFDIGITQGYYKYISIFLEIPILILGIILFFRKHITLTILGLFFFAVQLIIISTTLFDYLTRLFCTLCHS